MSDFPAAGTSDAAAAAASAPEHRAAPPAAAAAVRAESPRTRVIAGFVLLDLVIGYLWVTGGAARLLRRLRPGAAPAGDADQPTLGIGRFARRRSGPVPRL